MDGEIHRKVLDYEKFLNDVLKSDLKKVSDERDKLYSKIAGYLQLRNSIQAIKEGGLTNQQISTKVDMGCNFYIQAKIPDSSRIFVNIGFEFYLELTLEEALKFIEKKIDILNQQTEVLTKNSAKIKANIKMVIEGLREVQKISDSPEESQRSDLFW